MQAHAESSWTASLGAEADDRSASAIDADVGWSPTERFTLAFSGGHTRGADDLGDDFDATVLSASADWQMADVVGLAIAYDTWEDPDSYEKRNGHLTLYLGNERARIGLVAQSVSSKTTAQLALLRRTASIDFDGKGYGADLSLNSERTGFYASYVAYDYDDSTARLITFLSNPALARRPRLEALLGSSTTAAAALLDYSASVSADFYLARARIGVSWSMLRDIVSDSNSQTVKADVEWPVASHWSLRLTGGVNDSDLDSSVIFGGVRILFRSN
jgi:hypothetical protein